MLKPYVPRQYERKPLTKNQASVSAEEKKSHALQKLSKLRDSARAIKVQLEALKGRLQPFEWLLPVQYRRDFPSSKENQSGTSNTSLLTRAATSKYHLSETAVGAAMIENNAKKSTSMLKPLCQKQATDEPTSNGTLREKILKELSDLKGLEKRENIVRCINESRAKYPSKGPSTEQTRSSFEPKAPYCRPPSVRKSFQSTSSESGAVTDLAYSTVSIISSNQAVNSRNKPTSLFCPDRHEYYTGALQNGIPHGHGRLVVCCSAMPYAVSADTEFYNGAFENGKFHGLGTLSLKGGVKYVGGFKDGLRQGEGSLYSSGNVEVCIWRNDCISHRL